MEKKKRKGAKVRNIFNIDPSSQEMEPLKIQFEHADFRVDKAGRDLNKYFTGHLYSGPQKSGKRKQVVALENDTMVYIGTTQGQHTSQIFTSGSMKTYIAIKKDKTLSLYETTPVTVSPFVKGRSYFKEDEKDTSIVKTPKERRLANSSLVKEFGSKKKRLYLERQENNAVTDMNESILTAAKEAKDITIADQNMIDSAILKIIPPCNRDATIVSEVYKVDDLLTKEDLEELEDYATGCLDFTKEDIDYYRRYETFSDYFFATLPTLQFRKTDPDNILCMKLTLYAEVLIRLFKLGPYEIVKKIPEFPDVFPPSLVQKAFDTFTTVNALNMRTRSDEMRDKICCYIMVLVLLSNNNTFDVQLMATIFQIHIKKLLTLVRAVGITVKYNSLSKSYDALLKLPLPKQIERRGTYQRRTRK